MDTIDGALFYDSLGSLPSLRAPVYADDEDIQNTFNIITYFKVGYFNGLFDVGSLT